VLRARRQRAHAAAPRRLAALLAFALSAVALSACGSSSSKSTTSNTSTTKASSSAAAGKTVSVIYAGSLVDLLENDLGPAFAKATGYGFKGFGGGSTEDASSIKSGVREEDVFVSASPKADNLLEGAHNGRWVSWYTTWAHSPLVLGYNPNSSYGRQLAAGKPWYVVLGEKGVLVGRTDPKLDPKGVLTVEAVEEAAKKLHDHSLTAALASFPVYPETALVGRLQSGQLDAGFFYAVEAAAAHFPTVSLTPATKSAAYTITVLAHSKDRIGSAAFIEYLLSSTHADTLKANGLEPMTPPAFSGDANAVPASVRTAVGLG